MNKRRSGLAAGLVALLFSAAAAPAASTALPPNSSTPPPQDSGGRHPGRAGHGSAVEITSRVLVRWAVPATAAAHRRGPRHEQVRSASGRSPRFVRLTGSGAAVFDLGAPLGANANVILKRLNAIPGVAVAEPDLLLEPDVLPDDPYAEDLWGLLGPDDGSPYGIDAPAAWSTADGDGIVVAVVDSGLTAHPDLEGQSVPGYDFLIHGGDGSDLGCAGGQATWHGTHVIGTIAALAGNGIGVFGGAPGVKIQPVRTNACGSGFVSDAADAIRWAAGGDVPGAPTNPTPARVINASFGTPDSPTCLAEYVSAIADATSRGAIVVVSAGNSDTDAAMATPANCAGVLTVGATDSQGRRPSFSNYGATVDLSAPGQAIWSTFNSGASVPGDPTYELSSGTSMSAPHAASAAALVLSAYPSLSSDAVIVALTESALPVAADASPTGCAQLGCGSGIVNPSRALSELADPGPLLGRLKASRPYPEPGGSVTIRALAVHPGGVAGAEVRWGDGPWEPMEALDGAFGGPFEMVSLAMAAPLEERDDDVCVRASDGSGTYSDEVCTIVKVDGGPPSVGAPVLSDPTASSGDAVTFTAEASDTRPIQQAEYRIDGGPWIPARAMDGSFASTDETFAAAVGERVAQIDVAGRPCVVMEGGSVRCWGPNAFGAVGDGTNVDRLVPTANGLVNAVQVTVGGGHACAALDDGTAWCWGANNNGELGDGTFKHRYVPTLVGGLTDVTQVSAASHHTCALREDGTVWCWGAGHGLGDGSTFQRATAGQVPGLSNVVALNSGGANFGSTCALIADGTVNCWGDNAQGSIGDGTTELRRTPVAVSGLTDVAALSGWHPCATLVDGTARCWGPNTLGKLGDGTMTMRLVPAEVTVVSDIADIAMAEAHGCAVLGDGTVRCWGDNKQGELGDGTVHESMTARQPIGLTDIVNVEASFAASCALREDGSVFCWGWNDYGLVGDGSRTQYYQPVQAAGIGPLRHGEHTICVRATDIAGRTSDGAACSTLTVPDEVGPTASIEPPAHAGETFSYEVAFDEPVTGLTRSDFTLDGPAAPTCTLGSPTGGEATYALPVACEATGELSLTLQANSVADQLGNIGPEEPLIAASIMVDRTRPTATAPAHRLPEGDVIEHGKVPIKLTFSASDTLGKVDSYDVRMRTDDGPWKVVATALDRARYARHLSAGHAYRFAVRATDKAGNTGNWANGSRFELRAHQESHDSLSWTGAWRLVADDVYWGDRARRSSDPGAELSFTISARTLALVMPRGPKYGFVTVHSGGQEIAYLDLYADRVKQRRVIWVKEWEVGRERKITIRVGDHSLRPNVIIDAVVLMP